MRAELDSCNECLEAHRNKEPRLATINNTVRICRPNVSVAIDILGRIRPSRGYCFMLSMCDEFSRRVRLYPLRSKNAHEVSRCFVKTILQDGSFQFYRSDCAK